MADTDPTGLPYRLRNSVSGPHDRGQRLTIVAGTPGMLLLEAASRIERQTLEIILLTARVAELEEPWMPIETAPRDGTPVLLWVGVGMSEPWAQTGRWHNALLTNGWAGWVDTYQDEDLAEPTHWTPLPPAPDTKE